jgi:hypothetical protein
MLDKCWTKWRPRCRTAYPKGEINTKEQAMKYLTRELWLSVMDSRHNPLQHLDSAAAHYLMQVLGWMWSMIFCLSFLSIFQFHYVWLAHVLFIGGFSITLAVFRSASAQDQAQSLPVLSRGSRCVWKLDSEA